MHTGQLSDEILAARVAQGDQTAFETLYERHASIVLGITFRITGERTVAEKILQETFWRMWQSVGSYQPERGSFTNWLFRIARNLAIDEYRRRSIRPDAITDKPDTDELLDRMLDLDMNVAEQAHLNLIAQQARKALDALPLEQRQVIELAYFAGMTRQEIAEAIGQSPGTIHTRARLGLQKLREALESEDFEYCNVICVEQSMNHNLTVYVQNLTSAWNSHELNIVLPYYSEDYEGIDIGEPHVQHGRQAVKEMLLRYWQAFPDLHFTVQNTVTEENRIAISWFAEGTQLGPIMNIPPTGRCIELSGISIIEVEDGLVVRGQYIWDLAGMLRHMGLLPEL